MQNIGTLGDRMRLARKECRWTQVDLAKAAGVGVATIRRAEGGTFEPRMETMRRLADALVVRMAWLVEGEEPMTKEDG